MTFELDDQFEELMRRAYPKVEQTENQWHESRRVFFAGAATMVHELSKIAELEDEDEITKRLNQIRHQLREFVVEIKREEELQ